MHAYDEESQFHAAAKTWLQSVLSGPDSVRFPVVSLLAFLRIGTNPQVFERPLGVPDAIDLITRWLQRPCAALARPTSRHWTELAPKRPPRAPGYAAARAVMTGVWSRPER
ncbi:hypothetical protein BH20ACT8_BH20ACT8_05300 [soil metagenome]